MSYEERSEHCLGTEFNLSVMEYYPRIIIFTKDDSYSLEELSDLDLIKVDNVLRRAVYDMITELWDRGIMEEMEKRYVEQKTRKKLEG